MPIRLLTWNIRIGGRKKRRGIVQAITEVEPDIVALSEWLPGPDTVGEELNVLLAEAGYTHQVVPPLPPRGDYGAMLAARWPVTRRFEGPAGLEHRWAHGLVHTPEGDVDVAAVYVPTGGRESGAAKTTFLQWLVDSSPAMLAGGPIVVTGDFNCDHADDTGGMSPLVRNRLFEELSTKGWRDLYRTLHPPGLTASWWSRTGRGFRLDHVLGGPAGPNALAVSYLDDSGAPATTTAPARLLSDHVRLVSDLVL